MIVNLPGSEKAAKENLLAVIGSIRHGIDMLLSSGSADCAQETHCHPKKVPSMDEWLKEAKTDPSTTQVGMYLTHNGIVRKTAKARVRGGDETAEPVRGMNAAILTASSITDILYLYLLLIHS